MVCYATYRALGMTVFRVPDLKYALFRPLYSNSTNAEPRKGFNVLPPWFEG